MDTVRNEAVKAALQRWQITSSRPNSKEEIESLCTPLGDLPRVGDAEDVDFSITVDGSDTEVEATRDHPTVKVGYLRVAGSMVQLDAFRALAIERYIDPRAVRKSQTEYAFDVALPGSQLVRPGMTGVDTWRSELNAFLMSSRFDSSTDMTLADGLLALHGTRAARADRIPLRVCPNCGASARDGVQLTVAASGGSCPSCGGVLYLADALRTHEEYNVEGSNFTPMGRVMSVAERLMTLCYLNFFADSAPEVLRHTVFVTDGPLALHGPLAPLKRRFVEHLGDLTNWCTARGMVAPLMVGIEKSGAFVEHAELICDWIPIGHVMRLTNDYINRISGRSASNQYGVDEFYGRRFIYRTQAGDPLVITVPVAAGFSPYDGSSDVEGWSPYPTLRLVCEVLDSLRTRMYQHAVIPVALAHSAAALPLGVGRSVLTMMAQQNIPGLKVDMQAVQPPTYFKK
ncbi:zinc ribbon domain-containing protein [Streptomyces mirabilis]|uniref:zinc ribbon domain-containing protein n=1 Tax=Streptomyces sp. NPDC005388 TaxID=3156717 RepID=UPI0033AC4389